MSSAIYMPLEQVIEHTQWLAALRDAGTGPIPPAQDQLRSTLHYLRAYQLMMTSQPIIQGDINGK